MRLNSLDKFPPSYNFLQACMKPRFVCVLDFEATCDNPVQLDQTEVIEFPSVLLEFVGDKYIVKSEFQKYVKPQIHPILTEFCSELTGITQSQIDSGIPFSDALKLHHKWLMDSIGADPNEIDATQFIIVTCGDWDIRTMLPAQARISKIPIPRYLQTVSNIKVVVGRFKGSKKNPNSINALLHFVGKTFVGKLHSGIDDCRNIAVVVIGMACKGAFPVATGQLTVSSQDNYLFNQL